MDWPIVSCKRIYIYGETLLKGFEMLPQFWNTQTTIHSWSCVDDWQNRKGNDFLDNIIKENWMKWQLVNYKYTGIYTYQRMKKRPKYDFEIEDVNIKLIENITIFGNCLSGSRKNVMLTSEDILVYQNLSEINY